MSSIPYTITMNGSDPVFATEITLSGVLAIMPVNGNSFGVILVGCQAFHPLPLYFASPDVAISERARLLEALTAHLRRAEIERAEVLAMMGGLADVAKGGFARSDAAMNHLYPKAPVVHLGVVAPVNELQQLAESRDGMVTGNPPEPPAGAS